MSNQSFICALRAFKKLSQECQFARAPLSVRAIALGVPEAQQGKGAAFSSGTPCHALFVTTPAANKINLLNMLGLSHKGDFRKFVEL